MSSTLPLSLDDSPAAAERQTVRLSDLLAGVGAAIKRAYPAAVWTKVELVKVNAHSNGHYYLEVSERENGVVVAKASAAIWRGTVASTVRYFEKETGMQLRAGISLLVRARPAFHPTYGFNLVIEAIDPAHTLGELEARKRKIRAQLTADGVFDANQRLPAPFDFRAVLVVAPSAAAGLGDFQAEAARLQEAGVCRFVYVSSVFQGHDAPAEIRRVLERALAEWTGTPPDAVVIIRGGGAVNDLAYLNEYCLARFICDCPVPVFTGIGHERDSTVLDEVAHTAFDTPSKVILGIESVIRRRAHEARQAFEVITSTARSVCASAKGDSAGAFLAVEKEAMAKLAGARAGAVRLFTGIEKGAIRNVAEARAATARLVSTVESGASATIAQAKSLTATHVSHVVHRTEVLTRTAKDRAAARLAEVQQASRSTVAIAKRDLPALMSQVEAAAHARTRAARAQCESALHALLERASSDARHADQGSKTLCSQVVHYSRMNLTAAKTTTEALMREIAGQGPQKTLSRGFALVRDGQGRTVTTSQEAAAAESLELEFHDGKVRARPVKE